jgi:hypothetical protein
MKKNPAREAEVAFSRHAQPVWFRLVKYPVLLAAGYLLWDTKYFWGCFGILLLASVALHLFYRYKTKAGAGASEAGITIKPSPASTPPSPLSGI